jgi:hypothetical protein
MALFRAYGQPKKRGTRACIMSCTAAYCITVRAELNESLWKCHTPQIPRIDSHRSRPWIYPDSMLMVLAANDAQSAISPRATSGDDGTPSAAWPRGRTTIAATTAHWSRGLVRFEVCVRCTPRPRWLHAGLERAGPSTGAWPLTGSPGRLGVPGLSWLDARQSSARTGHRRVEHSLSAVRSVVRHAGVTIDDRRTGLGYDALYLPLLPRVLLLPGRCSLDVDTIVERSRLLTI